MGVSARIYQSLAATYLAFLVGPVVPAAAAWGGVPGYRWVLFSVGGVMAAAIGYVLGSRVDLSQLLPQQPVAIAVTLLPMPYFVWFIALFAHNPTRSLLTILGRPGLGGVFAFPVAMVAVTLAARQRTVERIQGAEVFESFTARPAPGRRRLRYWSFAGGLGSVVGLVGVLTLEASASVALFLTVVVVGPLALVGLWTTNARSVVITDHGIAVDGTFTEWDWFEDYEVTDSSLVFKFRSKLTGDMAFDRADVPSIADLESVLDAYLDD